MATTGLAKEAIGRASLAMGEGLTGWAVTYAQPVAVADALNDPRFKLLPETHEEGLRSLMAVPPSVQGRIIGATNVQTAEVSDFAADEVELLSLIANLAAGALEKATLYGRLTARQVVGHAKLFQDFVTIGLVNGAHDQSIKMHIDTHTQS